MKKVLPEFYIPTEKEFEALWNEGLLVVDANVLLGLYRYSSKTRNKLLKILKDQRDRLWIPHQVALEFHKNRLEIIDKQYRAYDEINKLLNAGLAGIKGDLEKDYSRHPFIPCVPLVKKVLASMKTIEADISKKKSRDPNWAKNDPLLEQITAIFEGKVGEPYDELELDKIYKTGTTRYEKAIPPGYEDKRKDLADKTGTKKFGDLIIWFQMIKKAKEAKKPVLFITDEQKEDWWRKVNNKNIGPRYELVREMKKEAGVMFYMYQTDRFMENASKDIEDNIITEIREVRESDEEKSKLDQVVASPQTQIPRSGYPDESFTGLDLGLNTSYTDKDTGIAEPDDGAGRGEGETGSSQNIKSPTTK